MTSNSSDFSEARRRWPRFSQRALLVVGAGVAVVLAILAYVWQPVRLPQVRDIARMQAEVHGWHDDLGRRFEVPKDHWSDVLNALCTEWRDRSARKWETYCHLELTMDDETTCHISVYDFGSGGMVTWVGDNWKQQEYRDSGSGKNVINVLNEAYEAAAASQVK
jgi:hypothetical protein